MTALGEAVQFLIDFGFFDVILPFLLVFTVVFGILEKTKIFGTEKVGDKEFAKKNINSMIAFVIAFFTIAAKEVVMALQLSLPKVALTLIIVVCFMLLAGSFMSDKEFSFENRKGWKITLTFIMFIAIILIFLDAFGWLTPIIDWIVFDESVLLVPLVTLAVVIGTIVFVVGGKPKSSGGDE
ncbi:hypothetical protein D6777_04600 [Candidatus Woesearchaeota archaeon]|nr:MAG: hypothetical protein D6777_04600 [Candidatus Woesearchaeota archaeon]